MKFLQSRHTQKGFTLVELVVVIGIISVLSAIVIVNIQGARYRARDTRRQAELEQVHLALETYRQAYSSYPLSCNDTGEWGGNGSNWGSCDEYIVGITNIVRLPVDEVNTEDGYRYISDGTGYRLEALNAVEGEEVTTDHDFARCAASCATSETFCDPDTDEYKQTYAIWQGTAYECGDGS